MLTRSGYTATRDDKGTMTVHRVPIFVECERGEHSFDVEWITAAVVKAKQAEAEGYLPPLHIRHHEADTAVNDSVRAAGFFRILGVEQITFKGSPRNAILADLIITDPATQADVLRMRYPYRSVEIFNVDKPAIDSLALLDHEAPFLELPMLMVSEVGGKPASGVATATLQMSTVDTVAACFRRGARAHLLFREDAMADEPKKGDDDKDEKMEGESAAVDVSAICKAIKDGSISVADMKEIVAAIDAQMSEGEGEAKPEAGDDKPAPTSAPSGETMKQDTEAATKFAAIAGENAGLKARIDNLESERKREKQVAEAMKRLEGRPLGADLEARLFKAHAEHGEKAFSFYVAEMEKNVGPLTDDKAPSAGFNGTNGKLPAVAMKYQEHGPSAVEQAAKFCAEWDQLKAHRSTSLTRERYVELRCKETFLKAEVN